MLECVPNVSEGRNYSVVDALSAVLKAEPDIRLLHIDSNADANRTVFTITGESPALRKVMLRFYDVALQSIDMRIHYGVHPRIGAVDVCPFIPFDFNELPQTIDFTRNFAREVAEVFNLPVYLYEEAAFDKQRKELGNIRKGELEALSEKMQQKFWYPDYGPHFPHPTAGATAIGTRQFLIAYNISLATQDVQIAKQIAKQIRNSSGNKSSLPFLKAIGWEMPAFQCVQVSTNLTDFRKTGLVDVYDRVKFFAAGYGVDILGSEIIGMMPLEAIINAGKQIYRKEGIQKTLSDEDYIRAADTYLGLSLHHPFVPVERILEYRMKFG